MTHGSILESEVQLQVSARGKYDGQSSAASREPITSLNSTKTAFGVEPATRTYRLRLARYQTMAEEVVAFMREQRLKKDAKLNLLDIGSGKGRSMRYIEGFGVSGLITFFGIDKNLETLAGVYRSERWILKHCDVEARGIPFDTAMFDIVICEQVLEHLTNPGWVVEEIARVLRPGGLLIVGTPTYVPGLVLVRRYVVPLFRRLVRRNGNHLQVFTYWSLRELIGENGHFSVRRTKGVRIASGGPFSLLEDYYWWYKLNRILGRLMPWLCPEIQVVARRQAATVLRYCDPQTRLRSPGNTELRKPELDRRRNSRTLPATGVSIQ